MSSKKEIKQKVGKRYAELARQAAQRAPASCCAPQASCCGPAEPAVVDPISGQLYAPEDLREVPLEAALASLGCGNPVALAELHPGEVVLDLGSGGGIDVLLSARRVGPTGKAYGLDMVDEMLELARENQRKAGIENVEFLKGEIEQIPLPDGSVDVIISNCVINLSTDKDRVFREAFRVLKAGGRLAIADIVLTKALPDPLSRYFALWTGCISGALFVDEYKARLAAAGFAEPEVEIVRTYSEADAEGFLPADLRQQLGREGISALVGSFVSAFVRAPKAAQSAPSTPNRTN